MALGARRRPPAPPFRALPRGRVNWRLAPTWLLLLGGVLSLLLGIALFAWPDARAVRLESRKKERAMFIVSRLSVLVALVAAIVVVQPACVYACSCVPPGTPAEELGSSDAVFLGTVVDVRAASGPIAGGGDSTTVTLEASKVWKGQVTRTLTLTTPGSSASCGVTFEQGKEYVVYGRVSEGLLGTNLCSRTRLAGDAAEDIAALGAGQPPRVNPQTPQELPNTGAAGSMAGSASVPLLLVAFGTLAVVLGGSIIGIGRRRRR